MYKPGDMIQSKGPLSIANVKFADRPTTTWCGSITAFTISSGTLATVIGSWKIYMDGDKSNELYVLFSDGQHGWTYGECWQKPTSLSVKFARILSKFKR